MLKFIFAILKLLGIIIVCILGFLLVVVLTVLIAPIRYRIYGERKEEFIIKARISWLFHLIHGNVIFEHNKLEYKIRIFGIPFFNSKKTKKEKKPGRDKKAKKKKKNQKKNAQIVTKRVEQTKKETPKELLLKDELPDREKTKKALIEYKSKSNEERITVKQGQAESNRSEEKIATQSNEKTKDKDRIIQKILQIIKKMVSFLKKLIQMLLHLKENIKNLQNKIKEFAKKPSMIKAFLNEAANKLAFKVVFKSLYGVLKHFKPKVLKVSLHIGTGDPCSTGEVLGALSILYAFYGNNIEVIPDFNETVYEGKLYAKGRIRILSLLIIGIKLIREKHFRGLLNNLKDLKEEL